MICSAPRFLANRATVGSGNKLGRRCEWFGAVASQRLGWAVVARVASTDFRAISCSTASRNWWAQFDGFIIGYNYRDLRSDYYQIWPGYTVPKHRFEHCNPFVYLPDLYWQPNSSPIVRIQSLPLSSRSPSWTPAHVKCRLQGIFESCSQFEVIAEVICVRYPSTLIRSVISNLVHSDIDLSEAFKHLALEIL